MKAANQTSMPEKKDVIEIYDFSDESEEKNELCSPGNCEPQDCDPGN